MEGNLKKNSGANVLLGISMTFLVTSGLEAGMPWVEIPMQSTTNKSQLKECMMYGFGVNLEGKRARTLEENGGVLGTQH
jgi:hypothetical protein